MLKAEKWKIAQQDLELLEYMADHSVKQAALEFPKRWGKQWEDSEGAIRGHLHRIRTRIMRFQYYLNHIYSLGKRSPRVRKLTISGALDNEEEE